MNIRQNGFEIILDQNDYIHSIEQVNISNYLKLYKNNSLTDSEKEDLITSVGQLGWVSGITKPDLAFETSQLSSIANYNIGDDFIKASKEEN